MQGSDTAHIGSCFDRVYVSDTDSAGDDILDVYAAGAHPDGTNNDTNAHAYGAAG